jgi:hypothetical protein
MSLFKTKSLHLRWRLAFHQSITISWHGTWDIQESRMRSSDNRNETNEGASNPQDNVASALDYRNLVLFDGRANSPKYFMQAAG